MRTHTGLENSNAFCLVYQKILKNSEKNNLILLCYKQLDVIVKDVQAA